MRLWNGSPRERMVSQFGRGTISNSAYTKATNTIPGPACRQFGEGYNARCSAYLAPPRLAGEAAKFVSVLGPLHFHFKGDTFT